MLSCDTSRWYAAGHLWSLWEENDLNLMEKEFERAPSQSSQTFLVNYFLRDFLCTFFGLSYFSLRRRMFIPLQATMDLIRDTKPNFWCSAKVGKQTANIETSQTKKEASNATSATRKRGCQSATNHLHIPLLVATGRQRNGDTIQSIAHHHHGACEANLPL